LLEFHAIIFNHTFESGANKPVLCRAVNQNGIKEDIVIKLLHGERMSNDAFQKESIASRLATGLQLKTPEPYIAIISDEFVESQLGQLHYDTLRLSKGKNYSTKYIQGLEIIGEFDKLNKKQINDALKIFVFDLLIQNPDRTIKHGKPNLFTTGTDLWVLDHEIAFSFLVPIIGQPKTNSWEIHVTAP
jgi:hypothetical protein